MVVSELDGGLLLVRVTRGDGLQYSGLLATDDSVLLEVTPLPATSLLCVEVDAPPQHAASVLPPLVSEAASPANKRRYVKSGIYSKKNRLALSGAAMHAEAE